MARNRAELMQIQAELEKEMTAKGAEKFYRNLDRNKAAGKEENTVYGTALMKHKIDAYALIIKAWKENAAAKPGKRHRAYEVLKELDDHMIAFLALKGILAKISMPVSETTVALYIADLVEEEVQFENLRAQDNDLVTNILHKGRLASTKQKKKVYALNAVELGGGQWVLNEKWSRQDKLVVGVVLIDLAERELGLVTVRVHKLKKAHTVRKVHPADQVKDWIDRLVDTVAVTRPVREPMVVPPRDWKNPWHGGYLTTNIAPLKMVKTPNRNYLQELANTDMPIVYEAINTLQRVPWQINTQLLGVMQWAVEHGINVGGVPPKEDMPLPVQPHGSEKGDPEYKAWRRSIGRVHQHNLSLNSLRVSYFMGLDIAKRYNKFKEIYFPYQLDFRGRMYAVPYLNPQSADHHKSLLRFAYGRKLGTEGWKWLAIHGANVAGNDKISLPDRVQWVLDHEEEILAIAKNPKENLSWSGEVGGVKIDSPWQFLSFCFEWAGYCKFGEEFISKLPVALDGSCSGIQHFSAMFRDEKGGAAVNLVPSDLPSDVYKIVADEVIKQLEHDSVYGTDYHDVTKADGNVVTAEGTKQLARQWLKFGVSRKTTKRSVMTLAYGSKQYGFREQLMSDIIKPAHQEAIAAGHLEEGSELFPFSNDGWLAAGYMANMIWDKVKIVLVKAGEAMDWLQEAAKLLSKDGLPVRWTSPVGFPILQEYYDEKVRRVRTNLNGQSVAFFLNEPIKNKLSKAKQAQGVSPNFIHSCDASHMMLTTVRAKQEGLYNFAMIHDSFGVCAGECERMFHLVRETFVEMYDEIDVFENFRNEVLEQLSEKLTDKLPESPTKGTLDITKVLDSMYCFS